MRLFLFIAFVICVSMQACTGCTEDDYATPVQTASKTVPGTETDEQHQNESEARIDHLRSGRIVVKMKKENGVYKIPVRINGTEMDFIFDTGAGIISISYLEASFLYKQGKITKDDILGREQFQDATGTISEGAIINLKEVTIGNQTLYNVHASVTSNVNAPLLLGQSALEKFGRITIDYQNAEIIFQ